MPNNIYSGGLGDSTRPRASRPITTIASRTVRKNWGRASATVVLREYSANAAQLYRFFLTPEHLKAESSQFRTGRARTEIRPPCPGLRRVRSFPHVLEAARP